MKRMLGALLALSLLALASVGIAACGGGGGGGGGAGKKGGSIRIGSVLPDSYDPVLFQTTQANEALYPVYKGLVAYKDVTGNDGGKLVPALAEKMPTVSSDGKTYTFKLRKGLKYSDGEAIKASDFENSIKRNLYLGGPFSSQFTGIVGAAAYQASKKVKGDIPGITANDATGLITVKLETADTSFLFAAALANAALTPAAKSPFKKATPPGAGPYTIKVINPSREFILTKNPNFNIPTLAKGNVDKITVVKETVPQMTQDVISGKLDFMTEDPTGDQLPLVESKYKDRFTLDPVPANSYWFFMNQRLAPFNNLKARQAVNYAIDSRALERIFGGRLTPSCQFLPTAYSSIGYKKIDPCPWGDPNGPGNITKAKQLVQQSGTKGMSVTVWANNKDPRPAIADYLRATLDQIGYKAKTKILDQQVYFATIGTPSTKSQIGFTDWIQDYPHPYDFFANNVSGQLLKSFPTFNQGFVNDPHIDKTIADLRGKDPTKVADQWAALDKYLSVDKAYIAPYGTELKSSFYSERMNSKGCNVSNVVDLHDWTLFCLK